MKCQIYFFRCVHQASRAMIAKSSTETIYVLYPGDASKKNNYYKNKDMKV